MAGILACGQARRPNERGELVPPWLKIVVAVADCPECRGVNTVIFGTCGSWRGSSPQNYGLLVTAPRTAPWRLSEHCAARAASVRRFSCKVPFDLDD